MTVKLKHIFFSVLFLFSLLSATAQNNSQASKPEDDEFAKKAEETKLTAVIETDSLSGADLMKRAVKWIKVESTKYKKAGGTSSGDKAECEVSFPVKPKELNPEVDYTGKFTMKVVIECKNSKYRYTISDIKHTSKKGNTTAGSIDNVVPECGSMVMKDAVWKRLKAEALTMASKVVVDLKEGMSKIETEEKADEW